MPASLCTASRSSADDLRQHGAPPGRVATIRRAPPPPMNARASSEGDVHPAPRSVPGIYTSSPAPRTPPGRSGAWNSSAVYPAAAHYGPCVYPFRHGPRCPAPCIPYAQAVVPPRTSSFHRSASRALRLRDTPWRTAPIIADYPAYAFWIHAGATWHPTLFTARRTQPSLLSASLISLYSSGYTPNARHFLVHAWYSSASAHGAATVLLLTLLFAFTPSTAGAADSACIPRALYVPSRAKCVRCAILGLRVAVPITTYPSQSIPQAAPNAYTTEPQDTPRRANFTIQRPQDDTLVHGKYDSSLLSASFISK
ncbi:hypothetical protein FB451DRAFT_1491869 [Mycena latifolia]|nr:hypothetical protein FB451DRAFT_1491869 [Mycena latifolia]